jgi:AraC-like DNA-binding protein
MHPDRYFAVISEMADEMQRIVFCPNFTIRHSISKLCAFEPHSHMEFVVTAVLAGQFAVNIGASDYKLSAGQIAFTDMGKSHSGNGIDVEFVSIGIHPELMNELVSEIGLAEVGNEITFRASVVSDETITATARQIVGEINGCGIGHRAMLDALVRQLVVHLLRRHLSVRKSARIELSRAGPVDRRLRRAIEFMHDNYWRELALEEIASAAYLSEYHFARLFKQITGLTPHAYLCSLRLDRARKLLAETELTVNEIAAMVGYQSQSHFTKVFKSVTGLTPRAYRESSRR